MKTIWKFPLQVTDSQDINVPIGAKILSLQMQAGVPCIWALVDPKAGTYPMTIVMYGTGHEIHDMNSLHYLGSFQLYAGALVFHAFQQMAAA
jgi:hypothetical protein